MRISDWSSDVCSSDLQLLFGERLQGLDDDPASINLEEIAQRRAIVGATEAVGPEHMVTARHIRPDLLGECANPVARCDHRAGHAAETLLDITPLRGLRRMQQVPALALAAIARP